MCILSIELLIGVNIVNSIISTKEVNANLTYKYKEIMNSIIKTNENIIVINNIRIHYIRQQV